MANNNPNQLDAGGFTLARVLRCDAVGSPVITESTVGFRENVLYREADPFTLFINTASAPVAVSTGAVNVNICGLNLSLIGKCCIIDKMVVSLNLPALAQFAIPMQGPPQPGATANQGTHQFYHPGTSPVVFDSPILVRAHGNTSSASNSPSLNVRNNLTGGTVNYVGAVSVSGWRMADDIDFGAPRVAMFVGDSIINGTGPTISATMYPYIFKSYLASVGPRARVVLKSISGATSSDHEQYRAGGWHDINQCDLIFYGVGVNDAIGGVSGATFTANLTAFWSWASRRYPIAKVVILGASPLENNTQEAAAVTLRAAASAFVASVNAPNRLAFIDLGSSFDRTVTSNYVGTDTPGSRLHPNNTGHAAIAATIQSGWAALGWAL